MKEVMSNEDSDGTESFEGALGDDKAVGITIDQDIEQNVAYNLVEPPSVVSAAVQHPHHLTILHLAQNLDQGDGQCACGGQ